MTSKGIVKDHYKNKEESSAFDDVKEALEKTSGGFESVKEALKQTSHQKKSEVIKTDYEKQLEQKNKSIEELASTTGMEGTFFKPGEIVSIKHGRFKVKHFGRKLIMFEACPGTHCFGEQDVRKEARVRRLD